MGYDLTPKNNDADDFHFGAFIFPILLEACGYLFPCIQSESRWYCVFGADSRMGDGEYPLIISNDGFQVTAEEASIMARVARNFVTIQRSLPDDNQTEDMRSKSTFNQEDVIAALQRGMFGSEEKWPVKIRTDFVDRFEQFAEWAERSGGFEIW